MVLTGLLWNMGVSSTRKVQEGIPDLLLILTQDTVLSLRRGQAALCHLWQRGTCEDPIVPSKGATRGIIVALCPPSANNH